MSAETKWTKGSWTVSNTYSTHNSPSRFWETGVFSGFGFVAQSNGASEDEAIANAHLIAASPVMAEYIRKRMEDGDTEAAHLWEVLNGNA